MRYFVCPSCYSFTRFIRCRSSCFSAPFPEITNPSPSWPFACFLRTQAMNKRVDSDKSSFKNAEGKTIFTKYWRPSNNRPRALVFIAHGFGEHCLRYERLGTALAEQGYLAFSHDHVGHGRSEGERVHVSDFEHYVRDVFKHIDQVVADNKGIPIFMFGHSMGGTIAVLCVMERPDFFTGAVFSSPSIQADPKTASHCKIFLGKMVAWIAPSYQVLPPIDPSILSRNPLQVEKYANDPLNWHEGMKVKWTTEILGAMDGIQKNVSKVTAPYLLIHGDDDQIVPIEGSHFLHEHSPSADKTYKVFQNGRHELLNEVEEMASEAHKDILDWIHQRLP